MKPLLDISRLGIAFPRPGGGVTQIVNDVSFTVEKGQTLGLVGESGSGKSLIALAIMGLLPSSAIMSGEILLDGQNLVGLDDRAMSTIRGNRIGMIFQEPMTALNPAMTIGDQVAEGIVRRRGAEWESARRDAVRLLDRVHISDAAHKANTYPHEMSGGQRQRVGIAIALALEPDLLIADEPTTALDVTVQAEILDILDDLVSETGMALMLVSHDLGIIARVARDVLVLYAGTRMEEGKTADVLHRSLNPYTRGLLSAMPKKRESREARLTTIAGTVPRFDRLPPGCRFTPRCTERIDACSLSEPGWRITAEGRGVRCHLVGGRDE